MRIVVVGAGAAGVPIATRLSELPANEVTLVEAGSIGAPPKDLVDGGKLRGADPAHPANWAYPGELAAGRTVTVARGRILGGSTAINGGYFVRATPSDFGRWAQAGGDAWRYENALPILRDLEHDLDFGSSAMHGGAGPMRVARPPQASPASAALLAAATELGFPTTPDKNAAGAVGAGPVPSNIIDGVRVSTAAAYLTEEARGRIAIHGDTRALRIVFEGVRAVGVETDRGFVAADEVVLAAGSIATPHLLMLSGIGPATHLRELGISVVADLPVGETFSDHPNLALPWRTARPIVDWDAGYGFPTSLNVDAATVDPSLEACPEGDLEILLTAKPLDDLVAGVRPDPEQLHLMVALQAHRGRGWLSLASSDPLDPPRIEYRYLKFDEDRRRFRAAVRTAVRLLESHAFSGIYGGLLPSTPDSTALDRSTLGDDDALDTWIRQHLGTALHTCATAPMGSVTDGAGRVRGVPGLRVADLSILPSAPHRGPANTAVFIGEFIARQMLTR